MRLGVDRTRARGRARRRGGSASGPASLDIPIVGSCRRKIVMLSWRSMPLQTTRSAADALLLAQGPAHRPASTPCASQALSRPTPARQRLPSPFRPSLSLGNSRQEIVESGTLRFKRPVACVGSTANRSTSSSSATAAISTSICRPIARSSCVTATAIRPCVPPALRRGRHRARV